MVTELGERPERLSQEIVLATNVFVALLVLQNGFSPGRVDDTPCLYFTI